MDYTLSNIPAFSERIENLPMQTKKGTGVQKLFLTFSERIESVYTDQRILSAVAPSDRMIQSKLLQSAEPVGDGSMETSMSLGLMKSERYSEEDEIQPRGRRGSGTTTLTWEHWIAVIQVML